MAVSLVWFRNDLRLADNPALQRAARRGAVVPVFIWAPDEESPWPPGAASRWWLHHSLAALDADLRKAGSRLVVRRGPTQQALRELLAESDADAVFWNRRYEPAVIARDTAIKSALASAGVQAESGNAALLYEPWDLRTKQDRPYQVFTPFYKAALALPSPDRPLPVPGRLDAPATRSGRSAWPASLALADLGLLPAIDWAGGMRAVWKAGEAGGQVRLTAFLDAAVSRYHDERDRPDVEGTSRLSPHLHFGEVSPRQVYHSLADALNGPPSRWPKGCETYLKEVCWREFAHHLLYHFPATTDAPLREEFARFPWGTNPAAFSAWRRGRTGYPLVDAGMRELWATGWMHNRVRMVVASFLVKHLLLPWRDGARWFWDTLVDADLANNTLGWQWTAGCGADAAPYFRIFNPVAQGDKFDPDGRYVKRWVPELDGVPKAFVNRPWEADAGQLAEWGVRLGMTYPRPLVDHAAARARALGALARIRLSADHEEGY